MGVDWHELAHKLTDFEGVVSVTAVSSG
jgi:hypothetical protein